MSSMTRRTFTRAALAGSGLAASGLPRAWPHHPGQRRRPAAGGAGARLDRVSKQILAMYQETSDTRSHGSCIPAAPRRSSPRSRRPGPTPSTMCSRSGIRVFRAMITEDWLVPVDEHRATSPPFPTSSSRRTTRPEDEHPAQHGRRLQGYREICCRAASTPSRTCCARIQGQALRPLSDQPDRPADRELRPATRRQ